MLVRIAYRTMTSMVLMSKKKKTSRARRLMNLVVARNPYPICHHEQEESATQVLQKSAKACSALTIAWRFICSNVQLRVRREAKRKLGQRRVDGEID